MSSDDSPDLAPHSQAAALEGQEAAEAQLLRAARSERLPQSWLFSGPKGIGKATLAYRFAAWLFSGQGAGAAAPDLLGLAPDAPERLEIDPEDQQVRLVHSAHHPDLLAIDLASETRRRRAERPKAPPASEISAKSAREAASFLRRTPAMGGWRVVIADDAELFNETAANALLKILEEPPRGALLILITSAPQRLLPTLRSRCCTLRIPALQPDVVARLLDRLAPDLTPEARRTALELGQGSVGRALDFVEPTAAKVLEAISAMVTAPERLDPSAPRVVANQVAKLEMPQFLAFGEALRASLSAQASALARQGDRAGALQRLDQLDRVNGILGPAETLNQDRGLAWQLALSALAPQS